MGQKSKQKDHKNFLKATLKIGELGLLSFVFHRKYAIFVINERRTAIPAHTEGQG
ncbi:hypothetical protein SAMN05421593_3446 [Chryseobacterium culicis]|uniref:Uncharacterized protein n=1 Tax=Chryseobacterium culicis TaxID=680127 RepID=A0A1H6HNZ5_CHRCI|nr:hypothetical protein SAMN05421593_3446 [Chryseobacterium culicis]